MKTNNKGFTVIELILSFILVMFLALIMFALVNNYKNRQQEEALRRDLLSLQNTLTQDIYQDVVDKKVRNIKNCNTGGHIVNQCIVINFMDGTTKSLKIDEITKDATEDGTTFQYTTFNIVYGGVKYENPDPKFAKVVSDYLLTYTVAEDALEYGVIYHIKIRISHQDLDEEFVIDVVTTGLN